MSEHTQEDEDLDRPAVQLEAEAEPEKRENLDGTVPVGMSNGKTVNVPLQIKWKRSAQDFLQSGDWDSWAESVLSPTDLGLWDDWMDSDPEMGQILDFFEELGKETGQATGNRALRRSLRRNRAR